MLSLHHCKKLLGPDCELDEDEIAQLRDQLYGLAGIITDEILSHQLNVASRIKKNLQSNLQGFQAALTLLTDEEKEDVEERAAIIEFEAGADRDEAERKAILHTTQKRNKTKIDN